MLLISMILLGAVIGFVGAGGAGVTITLLTVGFGVPIHTALAVALASMTFIMISGAVSHFREHEVVVKVGAVIGAGGIVGALLGAAVSNRMPSNDLSFMTGIMVLSSALILYIKLYQSDWLNHHLHIRKTILTGRKLYLYGIPTGIVSGFLAGAFGIGAAAYIQIALMVIFGVPLLQSIGTCMMIILPISASGGLGYLVSGHLDLWIFLQTLVGLTVGAWIGAKFTHMAPLPVLKFSIVALPTVGGAVMLLFH